MQQAMLDADGERMGLHRPPPALTDTAKMENQQTLKRRGIRPGRWRVLAAGAEVMQCLPAPAGRDLRRERPCEKVEAMMSALLP